MADEPKYTPAGAPIYRHGPPDQPFQQAVGDPYAAEARVRHIERHVGPVDMVFHEIVSNIVRVDVYHVRPSRKRPFHVLVTSGMSDLPMIGPEGVGPALYAELVVMLPKRWAVSTDAFRDERSYWPVRQLKVLARLPHIHHTYLGFGHTIPNGDPAEPYADDTRLSCMMLLPPLSLPEGFRELELDKDKTVSFFNLFPLYPAEVEVKLRYGIDALLKLLDSRRVSDVIDPRRPSVVKIAP